MDREAILRDYKQLRQVSVALNSRLVKTLRGEEIDAAASALGMLRGKQIELETQDEIVVVMDYAIHDVFRDGRNAVARMLEDNPPPDGSLERRLLRSMQASHFTIFDVTTPIPGFGVRGLDGPQRTPAVIVDLGFSQTALPGLALATRIHSPGEGWWMTTGAALPLNRQAVLRSIRDLEELERRFGTEVSEQQRTTIILRACVASGASRQIGYADVGTAAGHRSVTASGGTPRIGRNDACPCGSGKKYKRCCGS